MLAAHKQRVRLYYFVCLNAFGGVIDWRLTQYDVVILPILLSKCTTMGIDLRLFDIWNGYCVGPKPTARTFYCCV